MKQSDKAWYGFIQGLSEDYLKGLQSNRAAQETLNKCILLVTLPL